MGGSVWKARMALPRAAAGEWARRQECTRWARARAVQASPIGWRVQSAWTAQNGSGELSSRGRAVRVPPVCVPHAMHAPACAAPCLPLSLHHRPPPSPAAPALVEPIRLRDCRPTSGSMALMARSVLGNLHRPRGRGPWIVVCACICVESGRQGEMGCQAREASGCRSRRARQPGCVPAYGPIRTAARHGAWARSATHALPPEMQNTVAPSLPRTPGTLSLAEDEHLLLGVLIPQHLNDSLGLQRGRVAGAAEQASHK